MSANSIGSNVDSTNSNTCNNCGTPVTGSTPNDPEARSILVCGKACAEEMAPLPTGVSFTFSEPADE